MSAAGSIDDMSVTLTFTSRAGDWATAAEKTGAHAVAADGAAGVVDGSDTAGSGVRGRICANGVVAVVVVAAAPVGWRTDSETRGGSAARPDDDVDDDDDDDEDESDSQEEESLSDDDDDDAYERMKDDEDFDNAFSQMMVESKTPTAAARSPAKPTDLTIPINLTEKAPQVVPGTGGESSGLQFTLLTRKQRKTVCFQAPFFFPLFVCTSSRLVALLLTKATGACCARE